jgi:hypothetical protein
MGIVSEGVALLRGDVGKGFTLAGAPKGDDFVEV